MTTNPWLARFWRRSENLLDGTAPADDPVARLLADAADPAGTTSGPLPGEAEVLTAFRASAAGPSPATPPAPHLPRSSMRTIALTRTPSKLLAVGLATAVVGGVAFAASFDLLKIPFQPVSSTIAVGSDGTSRSGGGSSGGSAGGAHAPAADAGDASAPASSARPAPSGAPTPSPSTSKKADDRKAKQPDKVKAMDAKVRLAVSCQIWTTTSERKVSSELRAKVTAELTEAAGGKDKILGYCRELTKDLCAQWPAPRQDRTATSNDTRRAVPLQCPFSLDRRIDLPRNPVPLPSASVPVPVKASVQPVPAQGAASRA